MVGILVSFGDGLFSGAMLVSGSVNAPVLNIPWNQKLVNLSWMIPKLSRNKKKGCSIKYPWNTWFFRVPAQVTQLQVQDPSKKCSKVQSLVKSPLPSRRAACYFSSVNLSAGFVLKDVSPFWAVFFFCHFFFPVVNGRIFLLAQISSTSRVVTTQIWTRQVSSTQRP